MAVQAAITDTCRKNEYCSKRKPEQEEESVKSIDFGRHEESPEAGEAGDQRRNGKPPTEVERDDEEDGRTVQSGHQW